MRHSCMALVTGLLLVFVMAAGAAAQGLIGAQADSEVTVIEPSSAEPAYGTLDTITYIVPVQNFVPEVSGVTWGTTGLADIFQTSVTTVDWWAPVVLPAGALVSSIELEACDSTSTGQIAFGMGRITSPGASGVNITPIGYTGTAATPGCDFFPLNLTTPVTIDNHNNIYVLFIDWSGNFSSNNRVHSVRVNYKLQVSPAPASARFSDVPTSHPFFQYIEALADSGITSGCTASTYCPDATLTRGQMAVFLSRALGLHWVY